MSRLRTDVLALACIVGGAGVGGLATAGLLFGSHDTPQEVECAVATTTDMSSRVSVSMGSGEQVIVVAPRVRMHQPHCVQVEWDEAAFEFEMQMELENAQLQMEQARMEMEMAREMIELKAMDLEGLNVKLEGLGFEFDLGDRISEQIERSLQQEMGRLEKELKQLDEEIGR